jgi:hypothetical protein
MSYVVVFNQAGIFKVSYFFVHCKMSNWLRWHRRRHKEEFFNCKGNSIWFLPFRLQIASYNDLNTLPIMDYYLNKKSGFVWTTTKAMAVREWEREDTHTWERIYHMPKKQQAEILFLLYEFNDEVASNKAWDKSWRIFNELNTNTDTCRRAQR